MEQISQRENVEVKTFEVYNDRDNLGLLMKYFDAYEVDEGNRGVPVVFIGKNYLIGDMPILDNLENSINENAYAACPSLEQENQTSGQTGDSSPTQKIEALSLITVIGAAIVDSINPCAIAVLLILLGALLETGNKTRALKSG